MIKKGMLRTAGIDYGQGKREQVTVKLKAESLSRNRLRKMHEKKNQKVCVILHFNIIYIDIHISTRMDDSVFF